jgi:hypothetical protein
VLPELYDGVIQFRSATHTSGGAGKRRSPTIRCARPVSVILAESRRPEPEGAVRRASGAPRQPSRRGVPLGPRADGYRNLYQRASGARGNLQECSR